MLTQILTLFRQHPAMALSAAYISQQLGIAPPVLVPMLDMLVRRRRLAEVADCVACPACPLQEYCAHVPAPTVTAVKAYTLVEESTQSAYTR